MNNVKTTQTHKQTQLQTQTQPLKELSEKGFYTMDNIQPIALTFDQVPTALGEVLAKVNRLMAWMQEEKGVNIMTPQDNHVLMGLDETCEFLGKSHSTLYSLTSKNKIPHRKRGNKLYFFKDELVAWIENGGTYDAPFSFTKSEEESFEAHLQQMRKGKKHKPKSIEE